MPASPPESPCTRSPGDVADGRYPDALTGIWQSSEEAIAPHRQRPRRLHVRPDLIPALARGPHPAGVAPLGDAQPPGCHRARAAASARDAQHPGRHCARAAAGGIPAAARRAPAACRCCTWAFLTSSSSTATMPSCSRCAGWTRPASSRLWSSALARRPRCRWSSRLPPPETRQHPCRNAGDRLGRELRLAATFAATPHTVVGLLFRPRS